MAAAAAAARGRPQDAFGRRARARLRREVVRRSPRAVIGGVQGGGRAGGVAAQLHWVAAAGRDLAASTPR
eukprot:scaffold5061_cov378-Prasinococcus_capsulatus_cf.AAC.6